MLLTPFPSGRPFDAIHVFPPSSEMNKPFQYVPTYSLFPLEFIVPGVDAATDEDQFISFQV